MSPGIGQQSQIIVLFGPDPLGPLTGPVQKSSGAHIFPLTKGKKTLILAISYKARGAAITFIHKRREV
jgi:hypothetical protein